MIDKLASKLAYGITAKLEFDYACNRGHSFGEYYVHGVVNEIICANIDTTKDRILTGFPHPSIQLNSGSGRKKELDFVVRNLKDDKIYNAIEVKWAGSSHCNPENVLLDICRLTLIKNLEPSSICLLLIAGRGVDIKALFASSFLKANTKNLLYVPSDKGLHLKSSRRHRCFLIDNNIFYNKQMEKFKLRYSANLPSLPSHVRTSSVNPNAFAQVSGRFNTLIWRIENTPMGCASIGHPRNTAKSDVAND